MNLFRYDIVIINSSGGKDSGCAIWEVCRIAKKQDYPLDRIHVSHQDLGKVEWKDVKKVVQAQADMFGLDVIYSRRRNKNMVEETLLDYVRRRGKWPSREQRWCTSDFKRGPGARVITELTRDLGPCKVLYVFGFRAQESPFRKSKKVLSQVPRHSTKKRKVDEWLPIHSWSTKKVWEITRKHNIPYHWAYDLGMPRLSCVFCIFSPFDALVLAGQQNPELLDEYVQIEQEIGHTFKADMTIASVKQAIKEGYQPKSIRNWIM